MVESAILFISTLVENFGFWGVFLASLLQETIVIIPSSVIILLASFSVFSGSTMSAASIGALILNVVLPVTLGLTLGSLALYGAVYYGGEPFLRKFGRYIGIFWSDIEKIQKRMDEGKLDEFIFFIMRTIPVMPFSLINAFCGLVRWPLKSYLLITFAGGFVRVLIVSVLGWQLGWIYTENLDVFGKFEKIFLILIAVFAIGFIYYRRKKKQKSEML